jgi:hypothetical protein
LHSHYDSQYQAQPIFLFLDTRDGEVRVEVEETIGNGCSPDVFKGVVKFWSLPLRAMTSTAAHTLMTTVAPELQAVLDADGDDEADGEVVARAMDAVERAIELNFDYSDTEDIIVDVDYWADDIRDRRLVYPGVDAEKLADEWIESAKEDCKKLGIRYSALEEAIEFRIEELEMITVEDLAEELREVLHEGLLDDAGAHAHAHRILTNRLWDERGEHEIDKDETADGNPYKIGIVL